MESRPSGSLLNYHHATERGNVTGNFRREIFKWKKMSKLDQCSLPAKPTSWLQNISCLRLRFSMNHPSHGGAGKHLGNYSYLSHWLYSPPLTPPPHRRKILAYGKAFSELPGAGLDSGPEAAGTEVFVAQVAAGQNGVGNCPLWGDTCAEGPPL